MTLLRQHTMMGFRGGAGSGFAVMFLAVLAVAWSGCANYQLGTGAGGKLAFSTLYVAPVENRSAVPQAREIVSTRIREALARDGRIALVNTPDGAQATLRVVLTDYRREIATVREGDTGLARKFNETLSAACTLQLKGNGGRTLFERRPVSAMREVFTDSGQLQAEYQTVPLLAEGLADKVAHAVLDVW